MTKFFTVLQGIGFSIFILFWLYVAARMITRGIMRSIKEWKERNKNG